MSIVTAAFEIFVREWLRETNHRNEDGDYMIVKDYYVIAEDARGARFQLDHVFAGHMAHDSDADYSFQDYWPVHGDQAAAERLAARIQAHVNAAGELNSDRWQRIEGCYGSEAWQEEDAGGFYAAQEKARDLDWELSR